MTDQQARQELRHATLRALQHGMGPAEIVAQVMTTTREVIRHGAGGDYRGAMERFLERVQEDVNGAWEIERSAPGWLEPGEQHRRWLGQEGDG